MTSFYTKIIAIIRNTKIKTRIFAALLLVSITPTLVVSYISYKNSSAAIRSKISTYSVQVLNETSQNIHSRVQELNNFGDELCYSSTVQDCLQQYTKDKKKSTFNDAETITQLNNYIFSRTSQLADIYDIEILGEDQALLYGMGYHTLSQSNVEKYASLAAKKAGTAAWSYDNLNGNDTIVTCKQVYSLSGREPIGYLYIAIQEKSFSNIYNNVDIGSKTNIFITDQFGTTVSSKNSNIDIGEQFSTYNLREQIDSYQKKNINTYSYKINGEQNLFAYSYIRDTDWYLVCTIPYSYLSSELKNITWQIVVVCLVSVLLCIIVSLLISRSIVLPLNKLVTQMRQAKKGQLVVNKVDYKNNEFSFLQQNYNDMIDKISTLIDQNQKEEAEKRKLEIQMLQAQITPHFLFNTLNSLRWAAKLSQADSVSDGIGALARLLKNTIIDTSETVTIQSELKNIDDYLTIQKIRYGACFDIQYNISDEIKDHLILKFLLQPIVENSIIHGHEGIDHQVLIQISGQRIGNEIVLSVIDNGRGMDSNSVHSLLNSRHGAKNNMSGIGIGNVYDRIRLSYGEDYGLTIKSSIGVGTTVNLTIPFLDKGEVAANV